MEEDFYCYFNISPICLLSDCQFHNEFKHRISFGEDVCEHVDDNGYNCENCSKSEEKYLYYPPITDDLLINFLLLCGLNGLKTKHYYTYQDKQDILDYVKAVAKDNETITKHIRELLTAQCQEYGRM